MREKIITILLVIAGIIKLLPVIGVLGANRLSALYSIPFEEPNLLILMQHRAVLFGLLGAFLIWAAFRPALQPFAFIAGFVSAISFILIAQIVGNYNPGITKVIFADVIVTICLAIAFGVWWLMPRRG